MQLLRVARPLRCLAQLASLNGRTANCLASSLRDKRRNLTVPQPRAGSLMARPESPCRDRFENNNTSWARPQTIPVQAASQAGFGKQRWRRSPVSSTATGSPSVATWKPGAGESRFARAATLLALSAFSLDRIFKLLISDRESVIPSLPGCATGPGDPTRWLGLRRGCGGKHNVNVRPQRPAACGFLSSLWQLLRPPTASRIPIASFDRGGLTHGYIWKRQRSREAASEQMPVPGR